MKKIHNIPLGFALVLLAMFTAHNHAQPVYTPYSFTNFAGLPGASGTNDGTGSSARFNNPCGVAVDRAGNVYVGDSGNNTIRKISPVGEVTTFAGSAGQIGSTDDIGTAARFSGPHGLAVDSETNLYVADFYNNTIRRISAAGAVTTLAGSPGEYGTSDGTGTAARFGLPWGVAVDSGGNVYSADSGASTIRKISPGGIVTTMAGLAGVRGYADDTGPDARFNYPRGVAVDSTGNVYVADPGNYLVRKTTPAGAVTTLAGIIWVAGNTDGAASGSTFYAPFGVATDSKENLYVADYATQTIRKITPLGLVTTLGGFQDGSADGTGSAARFWKPSAVAVDTTGNVYVADTFNHRITKGTPAEQPQVAVALQFQTNTYSLSWYGVSGVSYETLCSTNLFDWQPYAGPLTGSNARLQVLMSGEIDPMKFFRVIGGD